jgi:hypothetical protein
MPTHLTGIFQTETGNQDKRPGVFDEQYHWLDPERTPFTAILAKLPSKSVSDPTYKLFEREHRTRWVRTAASHTAVVTTLTVDDSDPFRVGDIILVEDERMYVSAIASATTLTVTRGYVNSTAAAHTDDRWVKILFQKQQEHGQSGTPITTDPTTQENHVQIFKESYGESNTSKATKRRGPSYLADQRMRVLEDLRRDQEQMVVWGKKRIERASGVITRYSGGLDEFVTTNRVDLEGALELGDIQYLINVSTRYGSSKKLWFVGRDAFYQLSMLGLDYVRIEMASKTLGMAVNRVRGPHGEFSLIEHRDFENAHGGRIMIVDPRCVSMAVLRAMKHESNIQDNDVDGVKNQFVGEMGLWLDTEKAHTIAYNAGGEIY